MNVETINETINSTKVIGCEKKTKVLEGDISVPDIKPDILSLINVDSDVFITKTEALNGKVNVEGTMEICVLYLAEDDGGTIKSLNNSFNFYETFNVPEANEDTIIDLKFYKGPIECKIVNARKLNIKSPITLDLKATNTIEHTIAKDVVDDRKIELQKEKIGMEMLCNCKRENIEIKESVSLDEDCKPIGEILKACIKIINEDYKISYNKILAKADALIKIIYVADNDERSIESFETTIPVMGFIDYNGISEDMDIELKYNLKTFLLKPVYQDLKALSFSVESTIEIKACVYKKGEMELITDVYDTENELKCEEESLEIMQGQINQKEEIEIMHGLLIPELENIKILNIEAEPNIQNKNTLDGKIALEGNIDFNILYYNENKKILESKKMSLPFQQVVKVPNLQSGADVDVSIVAKNIDYKKVDDNQIQIKMVANVIIHVEKNKEIRGIKNIEVVDGQMTKIPSLVIYYVKPGDSLWKIAKRFKTSINDIMENNNLKDDVIYPNQQLIIPRKVKKNLVEIL